MNPMLEKTVTQAIDSGQTWIIFLSGAFFAVYLGFKILDRVKPPSRAPASSDPAVLKAMEGLTATTAVLVEEVREMRTASRLDHALMKGALDNQEKSLGRIEAHQVAG